MWEKTYKFGFWKACLFAGIIWGLWHAPLIAMGHNFGKSYPGFPYTGIAAMSGFCLLTTPIISYVRLKNGSVWSASIFHGTLNTVAGIFILMISTKGLLWNGILGIGGFFSLVLGCLWVYFSLKKENNR